MDDPDTEQLINEKVDMFWKAIEGGTSKRGQVIFIPQHILAYPDERFKIIVTFSEKRPKKSWFQVYMAEEEVPWEEWYSTECALLLSFYSS